MAARTTGSTKGKGAASGRPAVHTAQEIAERDALMTKIEQAEPTVFASVIAGKIDTGAVTATSFKLIDVEGRMLALLGTTDTDEPGLALFRAGSERAEAELMLEADGPTLHLNNKDGTALLRLHVNKESGPSLVLCDPKRPRITLFTDRGRPHISTVWPREKRRRVVVQTKIAETQDPRAWPRAMRALRANNRKAFDEAALDTGIFLSNELDGLWTFSRKWIARQKKGGQP